MYESHWELTSRPFAGTGDARTYYPAEAQQAALLKLRYALESRAGAAVLAGGSGLSKTLVAQTLLRSLPERFQPRTHIVFPELPPDAFLAYLAAELCGPTGGGTVDADLRRLEHTLRTGAEQGRHAVVAIDEAHLLRESRVLQSLRLLTNIEHQGEATITFLLVAQPPLLTALERFPELDERLGAKCLLRRFTADETCAYLQHRLAAAGAKRTIFDDAALSAIFDASHGVPRRINRIADLALLIGYAEDLRQIGRETIETVTAELTTVAAE